MKEGKAKKNKKESKPTQNHTFKGENRQTTGFKSSWKQDLEQNLKVSCVKIH